MPERKQIPLEEGLFTWPSDTPQLIGGKCKTCGSVFFPVFYETHSPDCKHRDIDEVLLSKKGVLRSYTIQHFPAPLPYKGPAPYAIGSVEFPESIQVFGQMVGCQFEDLRIGMDVEVIVDKLYDDEEGNEMMTWKFRPV